MATKSDHQRKPQEKLTPANYIRLRGARVHNLKSVDVDIPLGSLTVVCGVSGSGKTSLAFDTLYAEGQRRYIESFSSYARQFLQRLDRPEYDRLENLPPSIAVTRSGASRNNRSIVSSSTEIDDYLRLLYSKISILHCINCNTVVRKENASSVLSWVLKLEANLRAMPAFEITWEDAADLAIQLAHLQANGFVRLIAGKKTFNIASDNREELAKSVVKSKRILIVVDRLQTGSGSDRWSEALESAFEWGEGKAILLLQSTHNKLEHAQAVVPAATLTVDETSYGEFVFHENLICPTCKHEYPNPDQRLFSFNSPIGACTLCEGLAEVQELDHEKIIPDPDKSLRDGAIAPWNTPSYAHELQELIALSKVEKVDADKPYKSLSQSELKIVWEGSKKHNFGGLRGFFNWLDRKKYKMHVRIYAARWYSYHRCPQCEGKRLRPEALAFKVAGKSIAELNAMQVEQLQSFVASLELSEFEQDAAYSIIDNIKSRLDYLASVGLGYMQLDRPLRTLSGGEQTRVNLTSVLGSNLVSMLYVLDEPTVGLHPEDSQKLIDVIMRLRDRGNTVLVVEHETPLIEQSDYILEVGPLASRQGGEIVFSGHVNDLRSADTLTGNYLYGGKRWSSLRKKRPLKKFLKLTGASGNNLQNIDVEFPLNAFCVVSGVSGSGKSTLVNETLFPAIQNRLGDASLTPLPFKKLTGTLDFDDCILIDQGIGSRSSRSVPVTMVKAFDEIRNIYGDLREAKSRGLTASSFSFNNTDGRCSTCEGTGTLEIDMIFLADIQVVCPDCHGKRFRSEVLSVLYRDRTIADVLDMSVTDAIDFFRGAQKIQERLEVLREVGLDYIQLGQSSSTLSAGEAQRLKLANFLLSASNRRSLIIMDEPTTGLHFYDVERLIQCLQKLVDHGHSLIVVEHNEQILNAADWLIDIGPGAAVHGGRVVASGPADVIAACHESKTGYHLEV